MAASASAAQLNLLVTGMKLYVDGALRAQQWQVKMLREAIAQLSRKVEQLSSAEDNDRPNNVILVEELTKEEAKARVLRVFDERGTTDVVELHEATHCDIQLLLQVLDELRAEGRLEDG